MSKIPWLPRRPRNHNNSIRANHQPLPQEGQITPKPKPIPKMVNSYPPKSIIMMGLIGGKGGWFRPFFQHLAHLSARGGRGGVGWVGVLGQNHHNNSARSPNQNVNRNNNWVKMGQFSHNHNHCSHHNHHCHHFWKICPKSHSNIKPWQPLLMQYALSLGSLATTSNIPQCAIPTHQPHFTPNKVILIP